MSILDHLPWVGHLSPREWHLAAKHVYPHGVFTLAFGRVAIVVAAPARWAKDDPPGRPSAPPISDSWKATS